MPDDVAGRTYARVYRTTGRADVHAFLVGAVERSGGRVLYSSSPQRAPVYLGIHTLADERIGAFIYPFRATHRSIRNRPDDEHRLQIRYGAESTWHDEHVLGRDIAMVDTTLVLGVHIEADILIGLDPSCYDPLPMGISVEFKDTDVRRAQLDHGWHVIERNNITGRRRSALRAPQGLETVLLFAPHRLLDYVRLEREASDLGLDPALRYAAAEHASPPRPPTVATGSVHALEEQFDMSSRELLDMISKRNRLSVAVRGGVAEHHLRNALGREPGVRSVVEIDEDSRYDFDVTLADGRLIRVECKNCSPRRYANGEIKVEVQKTRATQGDPAGRLYRRDQFDVVAACLFAPTGSWAFRYRSTAAMDRDNRFPDRLAPLQRVTTEWSDAFLDAL